MPRMLAELLALVVPPRCALCAAPCGVRQTLCVGCDSLLTGTLPRFGAIAGLDFVWSAAAYEGIARDLVKALKFGARLTLAEPAAAAIAAQAPSELLDGAIVPVPPAPTRRRWRGFDAADAVAVALAAMTGLPVNRCLRRSEGRRQVGRVRAERIANPPRIMVRGRVPERAILVDDVVTTGATLGACAQVLRAAGSAHVAGITFARTR